LGQFKVVGDSTQRDHLSLTMLAQSQLELEDFSQHFAPAKVLKGTLICVNVFERLAFFSSGFRMIFMQ
jgi:hypothetical protein